MHVQGNIRADAENDGERGHNFIDRHGFAADVFFSTGLFPHRAAAAFLAIAERCFVDSFRALPSPPADAISRACSAIVLSPGIFIREHDNIPASGKQSILNYVVARM